MLSFKASRDPKISYRHIRRSDLKVLEQLHLDLFPVRYEADFFHSVVTGRGGIVSWGAVDFSRGGDELVGFITARVVLANESEIEDSLNLSPSRTDYTLVYILTIGVIQPYTRRGIGTSLMNKVVEYARRIPSCRAVYLHVKSHNEAAVRFYENLNFRREKELRDFYYIDGRYYDSFLFICELDGGALFSCSLLEMARSILGHAGGGLSTAAAKLWGSKLGSAAAAPFRSVPFNDSSRDDRV